MCYLTKEQFGKLKEVGLYSIIDEFGQRLGFEIGGSGKDFIFGREYIRDIINAISLELDPENHIQLVPDEDDIYDENDGYEFMDEEEDNEPDEVNFEIRD
jgi:hypothetical protein